MIGGLMQTHQDIIIHTNISIGSASCSGGGCSGSCSRGSSNKIVCHVGI